MDIRVDVDALEKRHRAEFQKVHAEVLSLIADRSRNDWELGRRFRRITDAALYRAAGFESFEAYVESIPFPVSTANMLKAISVFRREHVETYGTGIFEAILGLWAVLPGREDPAHVETFRFQIVVDGVAVERTLGQKGLTIARIEEARDRAKRAQTKEGAALDAMVTRIVELVRKGMHGVAGFSVTAAAKKSTTLLSLFRIPFEELVRFWRVLGLALLSLGRLDDRDRALLDGTRSGAPDAPAPPRAQTAPFAPRTPRIEPASRRPAAEPRRPLETARRDPRRPIDPVTGRPIRRPGLRRR